VTLPAVVIIVPVLRRPHRVASVMENVAASMQTDHRLLFVATDNDDGELAALEAAGADHITIPPSTIGDYAKKINAGYEASDEPFLFTGADDLNFHPGWYEAAVRIMLEYPRIGVVGTQDLGSQRVIAGKHATHSLVRRAYATARGTVDARRKVLHDGYPHEYVDDELVGTARHRQAFAFANDSIVEHMHPLWGKGETDELYDQHAERMRAGRQIFLRRRHRWT
jgi:glycosyltransferase involved in cell wall biosynthesis